MAIDIVLNLHFRPRLPWAVFGFCNVKHQPTVAAFRNAIFKRQLKVFVLLISNDVARFPASPFDDSVVDNPAVSHLVGLVISPAIRGLAIKQQFPAATLFSFGQLVGRVFSETALSTRDQR